MSPHIARVRAVLENRSPDHPPVSFWHHFAADQRCGRPAVDAHLSLLETYALDFLKVMNDNGYPHDGGIRSLDDLKSLECLEGDEPSFARQLDLLRALSRELKGRVWMATTLFNGWATLRRLIKPKPKPGPPTLDLQQDEAGELLARFFEEDRSAVLRALGVVGESLARFARRSIDAGADGLFLSVRDDWVDNLLGPGSYEQWVRPVDLQILDAVRGAPFNVLHVCGRPLNFEAFADYPVAVINWADRAAGPAIADVTHIKPAICGGLDNLHTLPSGTPEQIEAEVRDAVGQAKGRPIIIGPGCTFDPERVPSRNLLAACEAARSVG